MKANSEWPIIPRARCFASSPILPHWLSCGVSAIELVFDGTPQ
jgi:hypothetical protein